MKTIFLILLIMLTLVISCSKDYSEAEFESSALVKNYLDYFPEQQIHYLISVYDKEFNVSYESYWFEPCNNYLIDSARNNETFNELFDSEIPFIDVFVTFRCGGDGDINLTIRTGPRIERIGEYLALYGPRQIIDEDENESDHQLTLNATRAKWPNQ